MSTTVPTAPTLLGFHLALIQLGSIGPDKTQNLKHARDMIIRAAGGDGGTHPRPDLVVLPECFNSPYGVLHFPEYAETIDFTPGQPYSLSNSKSETVKMLSEVTKEMGVWLLGGSIPEKDHTNPSKLYNTTTVFSPTGELVVIHRKVHLFDIDIPGKITFMESKTLSGGSELSYFDTEFARIGLGICYDIRFPEMAMIAARRGAHLMIYPGAFNLITGPMHWELLQRARAVDNQIFVAMCSPARDMSAGYHAWGHSMVVDPMGKVIAETQDKEDIVFTFIGEFATIYKTVTPNPWSVPFITDILDPEVLVEARSGIPVTTQRRFDVYPDIANSR